jgi:protein-disulfide isomerase
MDGAFLMPFLPRLCSTLPVLLTLATPLAALDLQTMTDAEREMFRAEVRDYLLENPEVLMEAIDILQQRQDAAQLDADRQLALAHTDALFNDGLSWIGGNPDGDITLVEFMDYRCTYCKQAFAEVDQLVQGDGNIRFIVKEFPILGEQSKLAAQFAVAVRNLHGDATYADIHEALMTMRTDITPESLTRLAETFALDPEPLFAAMAGPEVAAELDANAALGSALQITGTPTFVMDDQMLRGYVPLEQMQAIVATVRGE